jgi:hypothetical protein
MYFLLELPAWLSFIIICAVTVSISLTGLYLVRRKYTHEKLKENHDVAAIIFNAFGLLYAVVVAFVVFVTWNGYDDATKNMQMEANKVADLYFDSRVYPDEIGNNIRHALKNYADVIINDEWHSMSEGRPSLAAEDAMRTIEKTFQSIDVVKLQNTPYYTESLRRVNELAEFRRLRIFAGNNFVPDVIWMVLFIGAAITISYTYFFGMKNKLPQFAMTAALTITITLILYLIFILDHPFTGTTSISIVPFKDIMAIMMRM